MVSSTVCVCNRSSLPEDTACVMPMGPDQFFSAPAAAQRGPGCVVIQIRLALEFTGVPYEWSETFDSTASDGMVCSRPPDGYDLSHHWIHISSRVGAGDGAEGTRDIQFHAPMTMVNACLCDLFCRINPQTGRCLLGVESSWCDDLLTVLDGFGVEVQVSAGGEAEILPLRLDDEGLPLDRRHAGGHRGFHGGGH